MNINITFLDNKLKISNEYVQCLEVENKNYFYRIVSLLNNYYENNPEEIIFSKEKIEFKMIIDYFNIDLNDKKTINSISKHIKETIDEPNYDKIIKCYQKMQLLFKSLLNDIDLPLTIDSDITVDNIIKIMNVKIIQEENILKNLLTLIEIMKELNNYNLLILVNLKQYLSREELNEFYKYSMYNKVYLLLIDNASYGIAQKYEKKLIIDDNLEEFIV